MISPRALNLLIRARVINITRDALEGAKVRDNPEPDPEKTNNIRGPTPASSGQSRAPCGANDPPEAEKISNIRVRVGANDPRAPNGTPRGILILPSNSNFARRLRGMIVHRPH
jgi:hypothetical protein